MKEKNFKAGKSGESVRMTTETSHYFSGTVVITDPCYIIPDDVWTDLCTEWFDENNSNEFTDAGTLYYKGTKILYSSTAHGDGSYNVTTHCGRVKSESFGVDAGTMCVITLEDMKKISEEDPTNGLYAVIEKFSGEIDADGKGNFIGDLDVYTDGSDEDDGDSDSTLDDGNEDDEYDENY